MTEPSVCTRRCITICGVLWRLNHRNDQPRQHLVKLPDMALNMLAIGEETGEMDKMLSKVADFYEDEVGAMVKALTSMLEPAMIVVVGGIVGSILLAMYLPMFTVFDQIQ